MSLTKEEMEHVRAESPIDNSLKWIHSFTVEIKIYDMWYFYQSHKLNLKGNGF